MCDGQWLVGSLHRERSWCAASRLLNRIMQLCIEFLSQCHLVACLTPDLSSALGVCVCVCVCVCVAFSRHH